MLTRLAFVAAVCCAITYGAVFDPYSRRYGVCKDSMNTLLVTPTGSTKCNLIQGLYNLTSKASLNTTQTTTYNAWVQSIETSIIMNVSYTTSQAKFTKIAAAFQQFELEQSLIYGKIQFLNISTWGPVDTVVKVSSEWNFESSLELIVPTTPSGNCKLFDLLLSACAGDSAKHTAVSNFIETKLKSIVADSTKTQTEIIVAINKAFKNEFFVDGQASWMTYFYSLNLEGYFAFSQWSSVAVSYQQQVEYEAVLTGQGMTCPFILALNATLSSTAYTNTQKGFIKQLMNYFIQQWTTVTTVEARLTLISMKFSESIDLSYTYFSVLNSIQIQGFGSWWQLIIFSCQHQTFPPSCGCQVPVFTTTIEAEATTTLAPMETTEASMEPSTTEVTTEATTEGTTEFSTEATSEASTWDSTFSSITFSSSTPGCTCSCEY